MQEIQKGKKKKMQPVKDYGNMKKLGMFQKKKRDYGRVIISENTTLVAIHVFCEKTMDGLKYCIYSIDSDFMMRTWNLNEDGECKQSILIKQCQNYDKLMSRADKFRNEIAAFSVTD